MECGVWSVEGEGSVGVVWYHRLIETGECGAVDSVVLVVAMKRRTSQGEGA